jgi:hypothetical protein
MRMGSQIDRHPIQEEADIRPMVCVEASEEVLIGLPGAAGMFNGHKAWDQAKHLRGASLGLQDNFFVGDELLRGRRHRLFTEDRYFRHFQFGLIRIVGIHVAGPTESHDEASTKGDKDYSLAHTLSHEVTR